MSTFKNMIGKIKPGMCRMSMNGIAINVNGEYKTFDVDSGRFTNCDDFVFDVGDEMFFAIPTNNLIRGDIIIAPGGPAAVIKVEDSLIKAFDYKTGTVVNIVPERHVFFGDNYFYTKIVSPFGTIGGNNSENMIKMMMIQSMFKDDSEMGKMMGMSMMLNGGFNFGNLFDGMFSNKKENNTKDGEEN